jgi:hypothetical protein
MTQTAGEAGQPMPTNPKPHDDDDDRKNLGSCPPTA